MSKISEKKGTETARTLNFKDGSQLMGYNYAICSLILLKRSYGWAVYFRSLSMMNLISMIHTEKNLIEIKWVKCSCY